MNDPYPKLNNRHLGFFFQKSRFCFEEHRFLQWFSVFFPKVKNVNHHLSYVSESPYPQCLFGGRTTHEPTRWTTLYSRVELFSLVSKPGKPPRGVSIHHKHFLLRCELPKILNDRVRRPPVINSGPIPNEGNSAINI